MTSSWLRRLPLPVKLGAPVAAALMVAACSSGSSSTGTSTGAAGGASPAASGATVIKTQSGSAGAFLTDGAGRTVYLWMKDSKDQSACSGACLGAWPPVTVQGSLTASGGANASDLGTITRSDGTKQATYDGHPLYYYAGDAGAGQANGQNSDQFGAKWFVVAPTGSSITASSVSVSSGNAPATPAPASSKAGGGWS